MVVIIVFEIVHTGGKFHVTWKRIPLVDYSMTEKVASWFPVVRRLGQVESGDRQVILS